ncbi:MAG: hypothetical protein ABRQ27_01665 [Clostridiaceae bacterium]
MKTCDITCKTWHDVLIEKGFDSSSSRSLIGFLSWNRGEEFRNIGKEITEIFSGYEGKVFARDVVSSKYNDKGILFFNDEISQDIANEMFDAIMSYEQNEVY